MGCRRSVPDAAPVPGPVESARLVHRAACVGASRARGPAAARRARMNPPLLVIVGPTASGKTALACDLAERVDAEIVSADSQQCYRGLDAGTAKPAASELARVPHHLLDIADPEEQLDAARFLQLADAAIADISRRGKRAILAGGTGLWIRALLRGLIDAPGASPEFRAGLRRELEH